MGCLGVHFALTPEQASRFLRLPAGDDEALLAFVEEMEEGADGEGWDEEWVQQTDKAWDAIHRSLTGGTLEHGDSPLHKCILGAANRHTGDDYLVSFLAPREVEEVAAAIGSIDRDGLRRGYEQIDPDSYQGFLSDDDFEYTWHEFAELRDFYRKAAEAGRALMFTVDQ